MNRRNVNRILRKFKSISGFTFVEVAVVIAIIGLLAISGHQIYLSYIMRSKITVAYKVLDEYQLNAENLYNKTGVIDPYYVLFSDSDTTGLVSGAPGGTNAVKNVSLNSVSTVTAATGTSSGNNYILLSATMVHDNDNIVSGADHVYIAGIIDTTGGIKWICGTSASNNDTVNLDYLPSTCQNTLP